MQPKERRETGEQDLFRSRLDQIIDLQHALVRLARAIDWRFLEEKFGAVYTDKPGHPPLPTRLMAGLAILKHMQDLSDEALCEHWIENPYYQYFCGEEFFQHRLVFDRSSLTRWRQRMGEEKLVALLQESLAVATRTEAMKPADLARVIVDTTVQPKAVMFPTDAKQLGQHGSRDLVELIRVERLAFAAKIRVVRAVLGWSQSEFGFRVGLTQRAIHKIEQGDTEPRRTTVRAIEEVWREASVEFEDLADGGFRVSVRSSLLDQPATTQSRRHHAARTHLGVTAISHRSTAYRA